MKKRVIPPPGIDPVFVPLACEVPRPFFSALVQRVQGFFAPSAPLLCGNACQSVWSPRCGGGETIAATRKIRPVTPRFAGSCSKRLTVPKTASLTSRLPRSRSEGLPFKHAPATKAPRGAPTFFGRCRRTRGARSALSARGAPRSKPCVRTTLSVTAITARPAPPSCSCSRTPCRPPHGASRWSWGSAGAPARSWVPRNVRVVRPQGIPRALGISRALVRGLGGASTAKAVCWTRVFVCVAACGNACQRVSSCTARFPTAAVGCLMA
jgi:hypothetical protein